MPTAEPTRPRIGALDQEDLAASGVAIVPVARRIPISRDFCTTDTASTLAMPRATASTTNTWIIRLEELCDRSPVRSCSLDFIQLSATSPVRAADLHRDRLRLVDLRPLHLDGRDAALEAEEVLGRPQRHQHPARVEILVADVEDAGDGLHATHIAGAPAAGAQPEPVAHRKSQVIGESRRR